MGIGTGVLLIVVGSVLFWAIDFDMPYIDDDAMGLILVLAGLATLVTSVIMKVDRPQAGIGTGVTLLAIGSVMTFALEIEMAYISKGVLGVILIVAGLISIGATGALAAQRKRERQRAYEQYAQPYPPQGPPQGYPAQGYQQGYQAQGQPQGYQQGYQGQDYRYPQQDQGYYQPRQRRY